MKDLSYLRPTSLAEALEILNRFGSEARLLTGGTDLIVKLQKHLIHPGAIVDLKRVSDISDTVEKTETGLRIGARVVLVDLIRNPEVLNRFPALVDAARTVGSVQIRNRATLVGNACNASPAADTVPPLIVYGASVVIAGEDGSRTVPLEEFFLGPGISVCGVDEIVVAIEIPSTEADSGAAFGRLTRRKGSDLATINLACLVESAGNAVFAFGAVGPVPVVARESKGRLADPNLSKESRRSILKKLISEIQPISDVRATAAYRSAMTLTLGERILKEALAHRREKR